MSIVESVATKILTNSVDLQFNGLHYYRPYEFYNRSDEYSKGEIVWHKMPHGIAMSQCWYLLPMEIRWPRP